MDLQELISRGRFIFSRAARRLDVYKLVDGRRTAKDIAKLLKRHVNNIHRDLRALADVELIQERQKGGQTITKDGFALYEKTPLARAVPISYFSGPTRLARPPAATVRAAKGKGKPRQSLSVPTENELLDMCKKGEDQ